MLVFLSLFSSQHFQIFEICYGFWHLLLFLLTITVRTATVLSHKHCKGEWWKYRLPPYMGGLFKTFCFTIKIKFTIKINLICKAWFVSRALVIPLAVGAPGRKLAFSDTHHCGQVASLSRHWLQEGVVKYENWCYKTCYHLIRKCVVWELDIIIIIQHPHISFIKLWREFLKQWKMAMMFWRM